MIEKEPMQVHLFFADVLHLLLSKKKASISLSTAKVEYIIVACCMQVLCETQNCTLELVHIAIYKSFKLKLKSSKNREL